MITYRRGHSLVDALRAYQIISGLDVHYPDFTSWFWNKCVPGIHLGRDGLLLAEQHGNVVGVSLWKQNEDEMKLRCVRVVPELVGRGVAIHLIDRALKALGCDKPICSVPEERFHDYSRMFVNRFDFDLTKVEKGIYRAGKLEYIFNGAMAPETPF